MTQIKTASNYGNTVEISATEFIVTSDLIPDKLVIFPVDTNDGEKTLIDVGYMLSYQSSIELAAKILTEVLGTENPEALGALMARIKADATQKQGH